MKSQSLKSVRRGTYVIEGFNGKLFEYPIADVRKGDEMEKREYLNGRIAHWKLMLQGAEDLVVA